MKAQQGNRCVCLMFSLAAGILCPVLVLSVAGCKQAVKESDGKAEVEAIRGRDASWVTAAQSKSVDAWVAFYADDAALLPPNEPIAADKAAIRKTVSELLMLPGLSIDWKPTKIEVANSGELAYLYGSYRVAWNDGGKPGADQGKIVEIWKKQPDGQWRCIVDTWNSDVPSNSASAQ